jgi:hypothetical protein
MEILVSFKCYAVTILGGSLIKISIMI